MPRPILHQPGTVSQEKGGARRSADAKSEPEAGSKGALVETDYDPRPPVVGLAAKRFLNASR
jgi:hypothetical protein